MQYNYRELVEALDEITGRDEDESFSVEVESDVVAVDVLKDITKCLIDIVDKIKSGEDQKEIVDKLQKACDILSDIRYNDESTEVADEEVLEAIAGCFGTEGMGPLLHVKVLLETNICFQNHHITVLNIKIMYFPKLGKYMNQIQK
ncbi:hypothetical protein [Salmonella phage SD-2_S15]|nr:hypothetical protein [Salmonella phage SD-2_S15]